LSIHLRADAIDALTVIGEAAASSAAPLIQWALTVRVIPMNLDNVKDDELFVGPAWNRVDVQLRNLTSSGVWLDAHLGKMDVKNEAPSRLVNSNEQVPHLRPFRM
jgi:hypothetical protein